MCAWDPPDVPREGDHAVHALDQEIGVLVMRGADTHFSVTLEEPNSTSVGAPLNIQPARRRLPNTRQYDVRQHRREDRGYI